MRPRGCEHGARLVSRGGCAACGPGAGIHEDGVRGGEGSSGPIASAAQGAVRDRAVLSGRGTGIARRNFLLVRQAQASEVSAFRSGPPTGGAFRDTFEVSTLSSVDARRRRRPSADQTIGRGALSCGAEAAAGAPVLRPRLPRGRLAQALRSYWEICGRRPGGAVEQVGRVLAAQAWSAGAPRSRRLAGPDDAEAITVRPDHLAAGPTAHLRRLTDPHRRPRRDLTAERAGAETDDGEGAEKGPAGTEGRGAVGGPASSLFDRPMRVLQTAFPMRDVFRSRCSCSGAPQGRRMKPAPTRADFRQIQ